MYVLSSPWLPPITVAVVQLLVVLFYLYIISHTNHIPSLDLPGIYIRTVCILLLVYYTMYKCISTDPGSITHKSMQPHIGAAHSNQHQLTVGSFHTLIIHSTYQTKYNGTRRYCRKCNVYKPDRTHHCYNHNQCVLRFDHCCGVLNNCIGLYNYKYFMLYVLYVVLLSGSLLHTLLYYGSLWWYDLYHDTIPALFILYLTCINISIIIGLALFVLYHMILIIYNITTVEYMESDRITLRTLYNTPYSKSIIHNIRSVLGSNPLYWLLPIDSHIHYTHNNQLYTKSTDMRIEADNSIRSMLTLQYTQPDYGVVYR